MRTQAEIWQMILAAIREELGKPKVTQTSIANLLGFGTGTVARWLNETRGTEKKTIDDLRRYMAALGMNPESYFGSSQKVDVPLPAQGTKDEGDPSSKEKISDLMFENGQLEHKVKAQEGLIAALQKELRILHFKLERSQAKVIKLQERIMHGVPNYKDEEDEDEESRKPMREARPISSSGTGVVQENAAAGNLLKDLPASIRREE